MQLKKLGQITGVQNGSLFVAIPQKRLIICQSHQYTVLTIYKDFKPIKTIHFDKMVELAPFQDNGAIVCMIDGDKYYRINVDTFEITILPLPGQIVAKIENRYLVNNLQLFQTDMQPSIEFEKNVGMNPYYYKRMPSHGYVYGYPIFGAYDFDKTHMSCFSTQTGKELWRYSTAPIEGELQLLSFIGNNSQQLWLFSGTQVVVLSIQTGKHLATIGQANRNQQDTTEQTAKQTLLGACSLEKTKLVGLWEQHYQEVSLKTFKLKHINLHTEFNKYDISCMYACFDSQYIYFYDSNWLVNNPRGKVAALDRKTLKIVWYWDMFKELGTAPLHIEVVDNQLYVLDNGLTLHAFEVSN